jgi:hypothetical protein
MPVIIDQFDLVDTEPEPARGASDRPASGRGSDRDSAVAVLRLAAARAARVRAD